MRARSVPRATQSAVVAVVMLLGFGWAFAGSAFGAAAASVSLFDDDAGRALFAAARSHLVPGESLTACIRVGADGALAGQRVVLAGSGIRGSLAALLRVRVEAGQGGRFGDCSGFSGGPLWAGTLADLAAVSSSGGVDTGWEPVTVPVVTFRVTVALPPGVTAQGASASGTFDWELTDLSPGPAPSPTGPTAAASPTGTGPSPTPTASPTTGNEVAPPTGFATSPTLPGFIGGTGHAGGSGGGATPDLVIGGAAKTLAEVIRSVGTAAITVVSRPQYPVTAVALALAFLVVQDRIDRRDPKLAAAARSSRDAEVAFPDVFGERG